MSVINIVILGLGLVLFIYVIMLYNGLVARKHDVSKAWANIDVLLKQRNDEVPKLVEVCKQYKAFEQETFQRVIEARTQVQQARKSVNIEALGQAEGALRSGLNHLFAVAEAYPDLKSNEHFMQLQQRITGLENSISDRRELYNEAVTINNVRIEQFPDAFVARLLGFGQRPLMEFAPHETADVNIKDLFR